MSEGLVICGVPGCTRPGYWSGVCTMHHREAEAAFPVQILREVGRDLEIELALPTELPVPEGQKVKIAAVPLAWQPAGGTPYGRTVLSRQAERVAMAEEGVRNLLLNRASYVIGGYVAGGEIDRDLAIRALLRAAEISGLHLKEATGTVRSGLRKGMAKPLTAPR